MLILDFLFQNMLLGLYIVYFLLEVFVNPQSKFVFFILITLYCGVTELINFVTILSRRWSREIEGDQVGSKLLLAVFSIVHAHYLYIALGPRFKKPMSYAYVAGMQSGQMAMKVS